VSGEVDLSSHAALERALVGAIKPNRSVIVELRDVTHLDSIGLHVLLRGQDRAKAEGSEVRRANPSTLVRRIIGTMALDHALRVFRDVEPAGIMSGARAPASRRGFHVDSTYAADEARQLLRPSVSKNGDTGGAEVPATSDQGC